MDTSRWSSLVGCTGPNSNPPPPPLEQSRGALPAPRKNYALLDRGLAHLLSRSTASHALSHFVKSRFGTLYVPSVIRS